MINRPEWSIFGNQLTEYNDQSLIYLERTHCSICDMGEKRIPFWHCNKEKIAVDPHGYA